MSQYMRPVVGVVAGVMVGIGIGIAVMITIGGGGGERCHRDGTCDYLNLRCVGIGFMFESPNEYRCLLEKK